MYVRAVKIAVVFRRRLAADTADLLRDYADFERRVCYSNFIGRKIWSLDSALDTSPRSNADAGMRVSHTVRTCASWCDYLQHTR